MFSDIEKGVIKQDHRCIAKAITLIDDEISGYETLVSNLFKYMQNTFRIGITGAPGCGKSTLTDKLIHKYRMNGLSVAVLCIDPTSPFSGGAILGDRIRMAQHSSDDNIFIRSLASRNSTGGLSNSIEEVACLLDAAGFDIIILETVGVGQIELEIVETSDATVVVLNPESGDEIQMLKAGLMEIGDIFVVNKSDRDGADKLMVALDNYLPKISIKDESWSPRKLKTIAINDIGVDDLKVALDDYEFLFKSTDKIDRKYNTRYIQSVRKYLNEYLNENFWSNNKLKVLKNKSILPNDKKIPPKKLAKILFQNS